MEKAIKEFYESPKWCKEDWYWARNNISIEADFLPHQGGKIVYHKDTSGWALTCLIRTCDLMFKYKRWPDDMNSHCSVVSTWQGRIVNRAINHFTAFIDRVFKTNIATNLPFRYQGRMVRDSYSAIYPALILHGLRWMILDLKPPWYVWSPGFYCWRKYLITYKPIYLKLYRIFTTPSKHEWIQRLHWLRETAIEWTIN